MATSVAEAEARRGTICAPRTLKRMRKGGTADPERAEGNAQKIFSGNLDLFFNDFNVIQENAVF